VNCRRYAGLTVDHYVGECDSCAESRAERFEHRLLRGEPARQALDPVDRIADFIKFGLNETPGDQWVAWIINPALQLGNLNQIDSMPNYIHLRQRAPFLLVKYSFFNITMLRCNIDHHVTFRDFSPSD
jgi:hypothetical protein